MAKRDFIFIDESGDPGTATDYYILGLIHLTDETLKEINIHLGAFRYFGSLKKEINSRRLNSLQKEMLINIFKMIIDKNLFLKFSSIYVDKKDYHGPYLKDNYNPDYFRNLMARKLLEFHFHYEKPQSREIEIIFDRFYSQEIKEQKLRNYLRTDKYNLIPDFLHIIQADSRYVELLQIVDFITGLVKEKFFTHKERDDKNIFDFIRIKKVEK